MASSVEDRLKLLLAELAREGLKQKPDPDAERRSSQAAVSNFFILINLFFSNTLLILFPNHPTIQKTELLDRHGSYYEQYSFAPGDIVKWKPSLNNRRFPSKDGIAIVTRVLNPPVYDSQKVRPFLTKAFLFFNLIFKKSNRKTLETRCSWSR